MALNINLDNFAPKMEKTPSKVNFAPEAKQAIKALVDRAIGNDAYMTEQQALRIVRKVAVGLGLEQVGNGTTGQTGLNKEPLEALLDKAGKKVIAKHSDDAIRDALRKATGKNKLGPKQNQREWLESRVLILLGLDGQE